jgi:hypothetical protein
MASFGRISEATPALAMKSTTKLRLRHKYPAETKVVIPRLRRRRSAWIERFEAKQSVQRQYCKLAWAVDEMARRVSPKGETLLDRDSQRLKRAQRAIQRAIGENEFGDQLLNICENERLGRLTADEARAIGSMAPAHFNGWPEGPDGGSRPLVEDLWTTRDRLEAFFVKKGWRVPDWLLPPSQDRPPLIGRTGKAGQPSMEAAIGDELSRWMAGGRKSLLENLQKFGCREPAHGITKKNVCIALQAWASNSCRDNEKDRVPTHRAIENKHKALLDGTLKIIQGDD